MCQKTSFSSMDAANARSNAINASNKGKSVRLLRPYRCDVCAMYHLTSMTKHQHRYVTDVRYRSMINTQAFIRRETEYWEDYYGI